MVTQKVKKITLSSRVAYILKETLDAQKPESLKDARYYMAVIDAMGQQFNFAALQTAHKKVVRELEDARDCKLKVQAGTAKASELTPEQDKLLRMTNDEWFAMLHEELERTGGASIEVTFPVDAVNHVARWLEKQSFNMIGARLMVQFVDLVDGAPETVEKKE